MEKDYKTVIENYSKDQLEKANAIISEMLACAEDAYKTYRTQDYYHQRNVLIGTQMILGTLIN